MKRLLFIFPLLLVALSVSAESRIERSWHGHEVRLGWGDQLFETLAWHAEKATPSGFLPESSRMTYKENYRYTQHVFGEYQYRFNSWFGFGGMIDGSGVYWDNVTRNGLGAEVGRDKNRYFYNLVLMPTARFTYFWHDYVNLYSGIGMGLNVNGGTEEDLAGHKTACALAVDIRLIGLGINYDRWFMNFDFGGMYSFRDMNTVYMLKSRMFTASFGARF